MVQMEIHTLVTADVSCVQKKSRRLVDYHFFLILLPAGSSLTNYLSLLSSLTFTVRVYSKNLKPKFCFAGHVCQCGFCSPAALRFIHPSNFMPERGLQQSVCRVIVEAQIQCNTAEIIVDVLSFICCS